MTNTIIPFSLKDAPALIERLLPVQKLSADVYKERMAGGGQTLTSLGNFWKGRKPLILAKACVLGCLLPATENPKRDLEIFELLMGMDNISLEKRLREKNDKESRYALTLCRSSVYHSSYRDLTKLASRSDECGEDLFDHIWDYINEHLHTSANSFDQLTEQLGIMRYGRRPMLADTFCGSGQIPFEAARMGCDIYASDLNPVACLLTWGAFNIVGTSADKRERLAVEQKELMHRVQSEIDAMGVETDGNGWRAKVFLYCVEVRCPQTGWAVPLLPTLVISQGYRVVARLIPNHQHKRYEIEISSGVANETLAAAAKGTVRSDGRGQESYMIHTVNGVEYRTKISTIRGDYRNSDGSNNNRLRLWDYSDIKPHSNDIFQERLYCIQWMRPKKTGRGDEYEFRVVKEDDLQRERVVEQFVAENLRNWQVNGWIPDMRIEPGDKTDEPIRTRGWTYWHHLFNPRQLLIAGLIRKNVSSGADMLALMKALNINARLSVWHRTDGGGGSVQQVFSNQALNPLFDYGSRATQYLGPAIEFNPKAFHIRTNVDLLTIPANEITTETDIFITDPPYGDAVKYEEILDFFIAWLRKNPPPEFADWVWDSRRALAIQGEGEAFRRGMVAAYKRMTECMPDNGIQVIMFTHQSGTIWADMANIVWAAGLQVTAAWYVATETDSALRAGSHVKGTVLLVCRKRQGSYKTTRDDLAWEIQEEVEAQVQALTGLNQAAKGLYRDENVFEDADIQMAGYAAALRTLTRYAIIDGRDMTAEALRPRVKGETTFVDGLIGFAVDTANQCLVPQGIAKQHWDKLSGAERFYLKLLDLEARGAKTVDNYQNFAKAFKVRDFKALLASHKANNARLKSAVEFGRAEMGEGSELYESVLRAVLYAMMEMVKNIDSNEVLAHLTLNIPNYYGDMTQRELAIDLADYLAHQLEALRPEEASAARIVRELIRNQRLG
ncbi:anti-phage-associated DUF1156 domain-containing protein [Candidatus Chloroploca asiatica]|uniref:DNA methylase n=1 Tax=Candidatus Chloroploca asiatica TaxID=1506545 RepID=A0A2H3KGJ9_9CHLR|nr:anti-phage-associated DUF1156 domain-containing protein [Candidatus Chloroploca asiatica]PDV96875.1 DNA methylase [Candidatus Chloroploca asiatica]